MDNLKLVSVRLDPQDIAVLDKTAEENGYRVRGEYIRAGVRLMAALCEKGLQEQVFRFRPRLGDVLDEFELHYHRTR